MATNNSFNIIGLDFDETKKSLKDYLSSQQTLMDYNFDGSILNTILDVLAYNTHYQSFYANMIANEMFLDSSILRPSVVSHAKTIGYTPSSKRASTAVVNLAPPGVFAPFLGRGAEFIGVASSGDIYRFVLVNTAYVTVNGQFENVQIKEGTLRRISYVYDGAKKSTSVLVIPSDKIDTTTILVRVQSSVTDNTGVNDKWIQANSYMNMTPTSKVFFIQEREAGMYELYFGDNFYGVQPKVGSIVVIEYLETNGDAANGISNFTTTIAGLGVPNLVSISSGGSSEESVSSIKFLAPKMYQSAGRAVTQNDYIAVVFKEYPNADSVLVYGGETTVPPQYGKVFIAIKPKSGSALTSVEKTSLVEFLKKNSSIVTITPEIVDADYLDIIVKSIVTYNPDSLSFSVGTLKALIVARLFVYSNSILESFGDNFYLSKMSDTINELSPAIISNQTQISLRKTIDMSKFLVSKGFVVDFKNPITKNPITKNTTQNVVSNYITHKNYVGTVVGRCQVCDDGAGVLNVVHVDPITGVVTSVYPAVGSVDYEIGVVSFNGKFNPMILTAVQSYLHINVIPVNTDLFVFENKILRISRVYTDSISLQMVPYESRKKFLTV